MALWTPADYAGGVLASWHDPSNAAGITLNSGNVAADDDLGPNNFDETQASSGSQPGYLTSYLNGLAVEDFSSGKYLETSLDSGPVVRTFIALIKWAGATPDGSAIYGAQNHGGLEFRVFNDGGLNFVRQNQVDIAHGTAGTVPNGSWSIVVGSYRQGTGAYAFRVNGSATGSGTSAVAVVGGGYYVGRQIFGGEELNCPMGERLALDDDTTSNAELAEGYIAWKYGLQTGAGGVLPSGHPYYSAAPTTGAPSPSVGSASGTSTALAVGRSLFTGAGSAAGTSTASAVGKSLFTSTGTGTGTSTASAVGRSLFTGTGSAAGTSTALGTSQSLFRVTGSAAGTSTALGVSVAVAPTPAFQSDAFQTNAFQAQYVISLSLSANVTLSDSLYSQRTVNLALTDDVTLSDTVSSVIRPRKIGMVWAYQWIVLTVDRADN